MVIQVNSHTVVVCTGSLVLTIVGSMQNMLNLSWQHAEHAQPSGYSGIPVTIYPFSTHPYIRLMITKDALSALCK